jgi:2-isopropylmalate synthase
VIRVNSQSGKGGISYLLETEYGLELPRRLQIEFSRAVQRVMDLEGKELSASDLWALFEREYGLGDVHVEHQAIDEADGGLRLCADVRVGARAMHVVGQGNGPVDAFVAGLGAHTDEAVEVLDYHEHAIGSGAQARAAAYLEVRIGGRPALFGVGIDANIVSASMKAVLSGLQRVGALKVDDRSEQWATS